MRDAGDAEKRMCLIFAPRFLRGVFLRRKILHIGYVKTKRKEQKK